MYWRIEEFVLHPWAPHKSRTGTESCEKRLTSLLKRQKRMLVGVVTDFQNWNGSVDETVCWLSTAFSPILVMSSFLLLSCVYISVWMYASVKCLCVHVCMCVFEWRLCKCVYPPAGQHIFISLVKVARTMTRVYVRRDETSPHTAFRCRSRLLQLACGYVKCTSVYLRVLVKKTHSEL